MPYLDGLAACERIRACLEAELDKVTVWPADDALPAP